MGAHKLENMQNPFTRTTLPKRDVMRILAANPVLVVRELNNRSFYQFFKYFWPEYSQDEFVDNWHIEYLCNQLQKIAERVARGDKKKHDIIINVPPGTSKTVITSIMFPAWCWTQWFWMKFITVSYSASLSLESAEYSRDIIKSDRFKAVYPELGIKADKDTKSNFRVIKYSPAATPGHARRVKLGGNRFSTSVLGTLTGYHGHIQIWDDALNPQQAVSDVELTKTNRWLSETFFSRKANKLTTTSIGIMQRLHQDDPTGYLLKRKKNIKHICLPGELGEFESLVKPAKLIRHYVKGKLDVHRMPRSVLKEMRADIGQYGYAGQVGQSPTSPKGGMFKVKEFVMIEQMPAEVNIESIARYWDKAGTKERADGKPGGAYTVGVKVCKLKSGKYIVMDVVRGRWESDERERKIRAVAEADGTKVKVYHEQEPGSGGKDSAKFTTRNLAGFHVERDLPRGDKVFRADPWSVQVNEGNVSILKGEWNHDYIEEHRFFPFSKYKDQVDGSSGAFTKLAGKRRVKILSHRDKKKAA